MKYLLAAAVLAIAIATAASAAPDPRLGTKACVVENAYWFDTTFGESGKYTPSQKSFILNVYDCGDALRQGTDLGASYICEDVSSTSPMLAIKTSLERFEFPWEASASTLNGELIPAEFRAHFTSAPIFNRATFRFHPDQRFELSYLQNPTNPDEPVLWWRSGTCADFQ